MRNKIKQLLALSPLELYFLFLSIIVLPLTHASLGIFGIKKTRLAMARLSLVRFSKSRNDEEHEKIVGQVFRMVDIAARYGPYRASCLRKSLTTWWLLKSVGVQAEIVIGVGNTHGFLAHAWVEPCDFMAKDASSLKVNNYPGRLKLA